jgi:hypothetical protein
VRLLLGVVPAVVKAIARFPAIESSLHGCGVLLNLVRIVHISDDGPTFSRKMGRSGIFDIGVSILIASRRLKDYGSAPLKAISHLAEAPTPTNCADVTSHVVACKQVP